jgi:hypothetical protein
MGRPDSIAGLVVELIRRRAGSRWTRATLGVGAAVAAVVALSRWPAGTRAYEPSVESLRGWSTSPCENDPALVEPTVVATGSGWLIAWTRWRPGAPPVVQVAALDRGGGLLGEVRTVSAADDFARQPSLARDGARVAVVWSARSNDDRGPRPWIAVVDANAAVTIPARPAVGAEEVGFNANVASDGQGWGIGWVSVSEEHRGVALARLHPDGRPRGPVTHVRSDAGGLNGALAWVGDAWLAPQTTHDFDRDRSALLLHWIDRGGALIETQRFAEALGELGPVHVAVRATTAWLSWGGDSGFNQRHDPRLARLEGRRPVVGPVTLGPRRSGSVAELACAASECLSAWAGVDDEGDEPAALHVQALDADGARRGIARRIGPPALLSRWGSVGIARGLDEREALAVWSVRQGQSWRLMAVRLGADGAPLSPPAMLPLP